MSHKITKSSAHETPRPAAAQPAQGKPAVKLTLEQKNRRLKDANTQLRKDMAALEEEYTELLDSANKRYGDLAAWKIPAFIGLEPRISQEEYDEFKALLIELEKTRELIVRQFRNLCAQGGHITRKLPELSMKDSPPLYWLNRLTQLHADGLFSYCSDAFDNFDWYVRHIRAAVNFTYSLQASQPEAGKVIRAIEEKAAIKAKFEASYRPMGAYRLLPERPPFEFREER